LIVLVYEDGYNIKQAASTLRLKYNTARTIIAQYKKSGKIYASRRGGGSVSKLTDSTLSVIENKVSQNPLLTIKQLKSVLLEESNINISSSTIDRGLQKLMITMKKHTEN
jgi:transposase